MEHGPILNGSRYSAGESEYGCDMERALLEEIDRLMGWAHCGKFQPIFRNPLINLLWI